VAALTRVYVSACVVVPVENLLVRAVSREWCEWYRYAQTSGKTVFI